jgi:hypothetical protein
MIGKRDTRYNTRNKNQENPKISIAKGIFYEKYLESNYDKYEGQLSIQETEDGILIHFDTLTTTLLNNDSSILSIFSNRLITPEMISCYSHKGNRIFIKELKELEAEHRKRFQFYVWHPYLINPQVIFIELKNKESASDMELKEFVKQACVSFVYKAGIII